MISREAVRDHSARIDRRVNGDRGAIANVGKHWVLHEMLSATAPCLEAITQNRGTLIATAAIETAPRCSDSLDGRARACRVLNDNYTSPVDDNYIAPS